MLDKLAKHVGKMKGKEREECKFRTIVLLDDFSASGTSYYMPKSGGLVGGKIATFHTALTDTNNPVSRLVEPSQYEVFVLLYVATHQALGHLREYSERVWGVTGVTCEVRVVQTIPGDVRLAQGGDDPFHKLIEQYYDHGVWDEHLAKGGTEDAKYGYAAGGLPLVLHHNTPNNSLCLLWSYDDRQIRGLFPRVRRHKEMS
jgi:hypothetical protein